MAKVFNDPIHGHIELHPLLVKIIDTPQFQRLRNIKQLGGGYFVFPGASHNRFEHSIGVGYLAGELAKALRSKQMEDLEKMKGKSKQLAKKSLISDQDILCVQIAGLCHDLGHGPFSHLFDAMFNPEADEKNKDWKHEDASLKMFDHLVKKNKGMKEAMTDFGLELPRDLKFIKEMINPPHGTKRPYKGRDKSKSFLYEIVSNKLNGIDVDKFDYFARDCHHLGIQNNFDHRRFIMFARVCETEDGKHICSRDKEVANLYDMFHTRNCLHRRAYQHRVTKSTEIMIKDALLKADQDKHFRFEDSKGKKVRLSEAKNDMEAYTKLTDQVIEKIQHPNKPISRPMEEARQILQRMMSRDLYKFVGQTKKKDQKKILEEMMASLENKPATSIGEDENHSSEITILQETIESLKQELAKAIPEDQKEDEEHEFEITLKKKDQDQITEETKKSLRSELTKVIIPYRKDDKRCEKDHFEVTVAKFDYGMKDKDPIKNTYFYNKDTPTKGSKISKQQVSQLLPKRFSEEILRVYWKNTEPESFKNAKECFKSWCKENDFLFEHDDEDDDNEPTSKKRKRN